MHDQETNSDFYANGIDNEKYKLLFENMLSGFAYHKIITDAQGNPVDYVFLDVNHAFEELTGLKKDDIIGKKVTDVLPGIENDPSDWIGRYGKVALEGNGIQFESYSEVLCKWYTVSSYCPQKGFFVTIFLDTTDHKTALEELGKSEKKYRAVVEDIPVLICAFNSNKEITFANKTYCDYFNKTNEELIGSSFLSLIDEADREMVEGNISRLTIESPTQSHEHKVIVKGGKIRWHRWTNRAIFDSMGKVMTYQAIGEDITERKKAEEAILVRESLLNKVGEIAMIGGWEMDLRKGGTASWTKGTYDIVELDYDASIPGLSEHLSWYLPEYREMIQQKIEELIHTGKPMKFEAVLKTNKGKLKWCMAYGEAIEENGAIVKLRGTFQDITERKQVEDKLAKYRDQLEEMVKERTKELEKKNEDLERFNKLFVDREFRIKELRERIKELENEGS